MLRSGVVAETREKLKEIQLQIAPCRFPHVVVLKHLKSVASVSLLDIDMNESGKQTQPDPSSGVFLR